MKILIAIDSQSSIKSIGEFLKQTVGNKLVEFYILKVLEPPLDGSYLSALPSSMIEEILNQRQLECSATVREMSLFLRDTLHVQNIHELTIEGISIDGTINQFAREQKVDLIVVGTHHRRGLARIFEGSVSSAVIAHAPCSVLVVDSRSIDSEATTESAALAVKS
ncbi:MAG: universal stress protein [Candidatus Obscuribacterales bacterium]|nr:universal stress protein [Candidatus Obscuribacterales bacterium]